MDIEKARRHFEDGLKHMKTEDYGLAVLSFKWAIMNKPNWYEAMFNLSSALAHLDRHTEAIAVISSVIAFMPTQASGWFQLGYLHELLGNHAIAAAAFDRASQLEPLNPRFRWARCQNFLSMGDFEAGWDGCESRMSSQKQADFMRPPVIPYFEGQDTSDKTLLIWGEQAIGEQIMSAGLIDEAIALCKHVIIEVDERLVGIFRRTFPRAEVYSAWQAPLRDEAYKRADYQIPALQLACYFRRSFADFPDREMPTLICDAVLGVSMREKYDKLANGRPIIGVAWKSNAGERAVLKSIPLEDMYLYRSDVFFVSLQYAETDDEKQKAPWLYRDPEIDYYGDYDRVAAQIASMDAVITVSNAVLHTAGALSVPTMAVLPGGKARHWYWFLRRADCPWYPSVNLFRPEPDTDDGVWYATSLKRIGARIDQIITGASHGEEKTGT